jgi:hypothetical protein
MITGSVFFLSTRRMRITRHKSAIQYSCVVGSVSSHSNMVKSDAKELEVINAL